jgi:hypothetical protein
VDIGSERVSAIVARGNTTPSKASEAIGNISVVPGARAYQTLAAIQIAAYRTIASAFKSRGWDT